VDSYVECCGVSDDNIIKGLSMLLFKDAATWWIGIRPQITTWPEARINLISAFGDRRPPHRIYLDIFSKPQRNENTDLFVSNIRANFAKLPTGDLSENAKLDITYALINAKIKQKLRREEFNSFSTLLERTRNIEDSETECKPARPVSEMPVRPAHGSRANTAYLSHFPAKRYVSSSSCVAGTMRISPDTHRNEALPVRVAAALPARSEQCSRAPAAQAAARAIQAPVPDSSCEKKFRPQCTYCKRYNHTRDICRKLLHRGESTVSNFSPENNDAQKDSFYSVELSKSYKKCSSVPKKSLNKKPSVCSRPKSVSPSNSYLNDSDTYMSPTQAYKNYSMCFSPVANDAYSNLEFK
jgi:hypothetical protein